MFHFFLHNLLVHALVHFFRPLNREERFLVVSSGLIFTTITGLVVFLIVYRSRASPLRQFSSVRDMLMDLEEGERGTLVRENDNDDDMNETENPEVATVEAFFPNILGNKNNKHRNDEVMAQYQQLLNAEDDALYDEDSRAD